MRLVCAVLAILCLAPGVVSAEPAHVERAPMPVEAVRTQEPAAPQEEKTSEELNETKEQPTLQPDALRLDARQLEKQRREQEELERAEAPETALPGAETDCVWNSTMLYDGTVTLRDVCLASGLKGLTDDTVRVVTVQSAAPRQVLAFTDTSAAAPMKWRADTVFTSSSPTVGYYSIAAGNIHPDGFTDLVFGRYSSATPALQRAYWTGTAWAEAPINTASGLVYDIAIGDADNDGQADEIIYILGSSVWRSWWNGTAWVHTNIFTTTTCYGVAIGDFDPTSAGNEIAVSMNTGRIARVWWNGTSWTNVTYTPNSSCTFYDVAIGNFDPGRAGNEVALLNGSSASTHGAIIEVWRDGAGTWGNQVLYNPGSSPWSTFGEIAVGNFSDLHTGDEVVAVQGGSSTGWVTAVVHNDAAPGTWIAEQILYPAGTAYGVAVGEVNKHRAYNSEIVITGNSDVFEVEQTPTRPNDMQVSQLAYSPAPPAGPDGMIILARGATMTLTATARNVGRLAQAAGVPVKLRITGPGYLYEDVDQATASPLAHGAGEDVVFAPTWTVPAVHGWYTVKAWTELTGDDVPENDTVIHRVYVYAMWESFTGTQFPPLDWDTATVAGTYANKWRRQTSSTYYKTSPASVYFYSYTMSAGNVGWLRSPQLDLTQGTNDSLILWYYHRSYLGDARDSLEVEVSTDLGSTWTRLDMRTGVDSPYVRLAYDLEGFTQNNQCYIRFTGYSQGDHYLNIDDILGPPIFYYNDDMAAWATLDPPASIPGRAIGRVPIAIVRNSGLNTQVGVPVRCTVYNRAGTPVYDDQQLTPSLAFRDVCTLAFSTWVPPVAADTYRVVFRAALAGDQNPANDVMERQVVAHEPFTTGGPDAGWYFWKDSDAPGGPVYNWVDITGSGTPVAFEGSNYDDGEANIPIGFTFRFYGDDYTQVRVGCNGALKFTLAGDISNVNTTIPNTANPDTLIAVLWDDLHTIALGTVRYQTLGTTPNCTLVVSYDNIRYYNTGGDSLSFQVLMLEGTNDIICQYKQPLTGHSTRGLGQSATVGVENQDGTTGLRYLFDANPLGNLPAPQRVIRFYKSQPADNVGLAAILVPPSLVEPGATVYPEVRVVNSGTNPQSNIPVYVTIRRGATTVYSVNTTYPGPLAPGATADVAMTSAWTVGPLKGTSYDVTAFTLLAGDQWPEDDTVTTTVVGHGMHRYFEHLWTWQSTREGAGLYGCTGVQDTLVWASVGFLDPWQVYILDFRTQAVLDSFTQYCAGGAGSYGYRDLYFDPAENAVYAGTENNRLDKIDANPPYNLITTYTVSGPNLPSVVRGLTSDGDSLYVTNWATPGLLKMGKDGTNSHKVVDLTGSPYGLGYDDQSFIIYAPTGDYSGETYEWGYPPYVALGDTVLPTHTGALLSGCEVHKDTFLLVGMQTPEPAVSCYRIIPKPADAGVVSILAPVGRVDTNAVVIPAAEFRNFRTDETTTFWAFCILYDPTDAEAHRDSIQLTVEPGITRPYYFRSCNVGEAAGDWRVVCSTYVYADLDPMNDRLEGEFRVVAAVPWPESWTEVKPMPHVGGDRPVKDGGWLAPHAGSADADPIYYVAKGNKTPDFFRYYPDKDSWVSCAPIPATEGTKTKPPSKGCVGVSDGQDYVYMTKGNNTLGFWRYDVAVDSWRVLPEVPVGEQNKRVKGGTDMVYVPGPGDTGWVYLLKGYKTEFYRFNTATQLWDTTPPEVPYGGGRPKYDKGSFLVYDPAGYLYAHQAKYYDKVTGFHYMFRYDLGTGRWTDTLRGMPILGWHGGKPEKRKKSKDGAAGDWYYGNIYALKGGNTQQFFRYFTEGDSWQELDTVPGVGSTARKKYVKQGGDLASYGKGVFFALKGNKTFEMWRYVLPLTVAGARPPRSGVMAEPVAFGQPAVTLAPNPLASGIATLRYSLPRPGPASIAVFDVAGRVVQRSIVMAQRSGATTLDLRRLANGVYLVRLDAEGYSVARKLVVQR